ncbi:UNVERIFIED_ORG: hypothetical protein J2W65_000938 [Pseudomonas parafulva]|uniref:hypothetical protein n=1 Tax=Pseudomonas TaxID=286 RepID=UPI000DB062C1|nr:MULTISPECIES: hypothetical protein [unclassified Pseudomonas]MDP9555339.1 hypothetical protein [Pseudomonas parafulva]PZW59301.1 hypothetical protein F478_00349 [Pseudomonas sp. URIL14HWK12:I2]PZW61131.1 hypothetical protein F477_00707 [Pseudomonas sp. URIL14HWK12:I3]QDC05850.1 hypothetical protein FH041_13370 [Pseudomonas sp. SWI7]
MPKISDFSAGSIRGVAFTRAPTHPAPKKQEAAVSSGATRQASLDLSPLAKQLASAAQRAAARDSQLSRQELATLASKIQMELGGSAYRLTKPLHDAHVPDTEDPELLARARQATDFLNGKGSNPFRRLTIEQLALIGYDEGGDFTHNERLAASRELGKRYEVWSRAMVDKLNAEYQQTGYQDETTREIIATYKALPPILEAGFGNYEVNMTLMIGKTDPPRGDEADSLIDTLLKTARKLEDQAKKDHPPLEGPDEPGKPA